MPQFKSETEPAVGTTVLAIIVTRNRAAQLKKTLDGILDQNKSCDILVIDNASTDRTPNLLERIMEMHGSRCSVVRMETNCGGAGGFYHGLKMGYQKKYWAFWLMDDDCIVLPSTLRALVDAYQHVASSTGAPPGFVCSNVRWTDGDAAKLNSPGMTMDWLSAAYEGFPAVYVQSSSFVSVLIPRHIMTVVGLPLREYFIWFDDTEYTSRISKVAKGVLCLNSIAIHDTPRNEGANTPIAPENVEKFKYGFRNQGSFHFHAGGGAQYFKFFRRAVRKILRSEIALADKLSLLHALLRGLTFNPTAERLQNN